MAEKWELARYEKAIATQSDFLGLVVIVEGQKPTPQHHVRILEEKKGETPQFRVEWRSFGSGPDVLEPYTAALRLRNAPLTQQVTIESASGTETVPVQQYISAKAPAA